jgi:hypothetical protein
LSSSPSILSSGYQVLFSWGEVTIVWKGLLTLGSDEHKNVWSYTSTPPYVFMFLSHRSNFTSVLPYP